MADIVLKYFHQQEIRVLIWPSRSPDWNIIEYCWAIMVSRVNELTLQHGTPKSKLDLFRYCQRAWRSISQDTVRKLYDKFPNLIERYLKTGV